MRSLLFAAGALLAVSLMPAAPASAASFQVTRPDTAGLATAIEQVGHRHRHHHHTYRHRYVQPNYGFAYRYYAVPRYAYRPYYYSAWSYPYQGVYFVPRSHYGWHHRHW